MFEDTLAHCFLKKTKGQGEKLGKYKKLHYYRCHPEIFQIDSIYLCLQAANPKWESSAILAHFSSPWKRHQFSLLFYENEFYS